MAAQQRHMQQQERLQHAHALIASFQHILQVHRTEFPAARPPVAPTPPVPDHAGIYAHYEGQALAVALLGQHRWIRLARAGVCRRPPVTRRYLSGVEPGCTPLRP
jgi:hypothetical protein